MPACVHAKSLPSCLTLCDHLDSSSSGSSVHGILQARIVMWVVISFSMKLALIHWKGPIDLEKKYKLEKGAI